MKCQICNDAEGIFVLEGYPINNWPTYDHEKKDYTYGLSWPRGTTQDHYICNKCRDATKVIAL